MIGEIGILHFCSVLFDGSQLVPNSGHRQEKYFVKNKETF